MGSRERDKKVSIYIGNELENYWASPRNIFIVKAKKAYKEAGEKFSLSEEEENTLLKRIVSFRQLLKMRQSNKKIKKELLLLEKTTGKVFFPRLEATR